MKSSSLCLSLGVITLLFAQDVIAQNAPPLPALRLEKTNSHKRILVRQGKTIRYKTDKSSGFSSGRIIAIGDSAVTFRDKKRNEVTIGFKDLRALIVPRSPGRKVAGYFPLVIGSVSFLAGLAFLSTINQPGDEGITGFISAIFLGSGALGILNGTILLHAKKINLQKGWTVSNNQLSAKPDH